MKTRILSLILCLFMCIGTLASCGDSGSGADAFVIMDQISDNSSTDEAWVEDIALRDAMKKLNEREKKIIDMRYFQSRTQSEIAKEIGISQAQVSRLEKSALERIRKSF